MEDSGIIDAQVALPASLYRAIQQRAELRGCSVGREIIVLLTASLEMEREQLTEDFAAWEAASDEDWLNMEAILMAEER